MDGGLRQRQGIKTNLDQRSIDRACAIHVLLQRRFTSKERDGETGLDYFGARYYASAMGRFTSPDRYNAVLIKQNMASAGLPPEAVSSFFNDSSRIRRIGTSTLTFGTAPYVSPTGWCGSA